MKNKPTVRVIRVPSGKVYSVEGKVYSGFVQKNAFIVNLIVGTPPYLSNSVTALLVNARENPIPNGYSLGRDITNSSNKSLAVGRL